MSSVLDKEKRGLTTEQMKRVKKMKVGTTRKECSICTNVFGQGEIIRQLPCKHIFHNDCVKPWLKKNTTCPNCRADIPSALPPAKEEAKNVERPGLGLPTASLI
eukprot:TRINITY_DN3667_c0_g1_i2.p2 TRINITY_DN3667_c0_g1~~TRINITY_DN3667_c0_g1_i2.p2  ORF type:complete len:104 (+),score=4.46 TRINITY_DN3667_c0_g1_i2:445-756(+)